MFRGGRWKSPPLDVLSLRWPSANSAVTAETHSGGPRGNLTSGLSLLCCQRKWFTPRNITSLVCEVLCVDGGWVSQRSPRPLPASIIWWGGRGGRKNTNKTKQNIFLRWRPRHKSFLPCPVPVREALSFLFSWLNVPVSLCWIAPICAWHY